MHQLLIRKVGVLGISNSVIDGKVGVLGVSNSVIDAKVGSF